MDDLRRWFKSKINIFPKADDPMAPPLLPTLRPRRLTLPLPAPSSWSYTHLQQTHSQSQSRFFSILSRDIRHLIYVEIFGNRAVHIVHEYSKSRRRWETWHCICRAPSLGIMGDGCREHEGMLREMPAGTAPRVFEKCDVGILRSCRRVYNESISLLYTTNKFLITDTLTLVYFPLLILPQRTSLITSLTLTWPLSHEEQPHMSPDAKTRYDTVWEALTARYPQLRRLRVALKVMGICVLETGKEEKMRKMWLESVEKVAGGLESLEITVPKSFYYYLKEGASGKAYRLVETPNQGLIYG